MTITEKMEAIRRNIQEAAQTLMSFKKLSNVVIDIFLALMGYFTLNNAMVIKFLTSATMSFTKFTLSMLIGVVDLHELDQIVFLFIWILLFIMAHSLPMTMKIMNIITWLMIARMLDNFISLVIGLLLINSEKHQRLDVAIGTAVVWTLILGSMAGVTIFPITSAIIV